MQTIFPYLLDIIFFSSLLISIFSLSFSKKRDESFFWVLVFFSAIVLAIKPFGIAVDDPNYLKLYENIIAPLSLIEGLNYTARDPIYYISLKLTSGIVGVYSFNLIAVTVFIIKMFFLSKLVDKKTIAFFTYFSLSFILHDLTQLRLSMAMMFVFAFMYFYMIRKKIYSSLLMLVFATLSHFQGLLAAPFLLIYGSRLHWWVFWIPLIIALTHYFNFFGFFAFFFTTLIPLQSIFVDRYLDSAADQYFFAEFFITHWILLTCLMLSTGLFQNNRFALWGITGVIASTLSIMLFSSVAAMAVRLNEFYLVFLFLLMGYIDSKRSKFLPFILLIGSIGLFYIRNRYLGVI